MVMLMHIMPTRKRHGGTVITMLGVGAIILLFALMFLELLNLYDYQSAIEIRAQRAINSTVEYGMDDNWRADGYNYLDVQKLKAQGTLYTYLKEDLKVDNNGRCYAPDGKLLYQVTWGTPIYSDGRSQHNTAGIQLDIKIHVFAGMGAVFGKSGYTWTNHFSSTNFRVDENARAGWVWH